jgi:psiF repeat
MRLFAIVALALALGAGTAFAADPPAKPLTPQQQKMKDCNAQATGKTGDERKTFMSTCLSSSTAAEPAKPMTQQEKMTACNAKATGKTGDDRKAFMSQCLKGDGSGTPAAH